MALLSHLKQELQVQPPLPLPQLLPELVPLPLRQLPGLELALQLQQLRHAIRQPPQLQRPPGTVELQPLLRQQQQPGTENGEIYSKQ